MTKFIVAYRWNDHCHTSKEFPNIWLAQLEVIRLAAYRIVGTIHEVNNGGRKDSRSDIRDSKTEGHGQV